jgi:CBS domain-containing protein
MTTDVATVDENTSMMKASIVMKEKKIKSLKDVAAELIPFFKKDDDSLTDSIISHLE